MQAQGLHWHELLADAGYANGSNYAFLEERGITPWIPVFGQYKAEIEGFTYDLAADAYTCTAGKALPFQKYDTSADGSWRKIYWAAYQVPPLSAQINLRTHGTAQAAHPHGL